MSDPIKVYPSKPQKVYYFGTCLVDMFYPDAGIAGVELLEREGIEVIFPRGQTCCGQPAYTSGYHDEARSVAQAQLDLFPEDWPIVVPSGSCGGMMRKHYPALFKDTPQATQVAEIAGRVWELTDFLLNVCHIKLEDPGEPVTVAMHTSCTARREMGVAEVGPALLGQLKNVNLVEQVRPEECCGFGGTFAVRHPEISAAMVSEKVDTLVDAGTREFVTTDCGCLMAKRKAAFDGWDLETLRDLGANIRMKALSNLPDLLEQLEQKLTGNGIKVHWAVDGDEACRIVRDICIAETGSLTLWPTPDEPRLMSLVPPVHIAVLNASEIYTTFHEAMLAREWAAGMPTNALLISGPSKTADIEQTLAYGVHGPKELIVLVIEQSTAP